MEIKYAAPGFSPKSLPTGTHEKNQPPSPFLQKGAQSKSNTMHLYLYILL